MTIIDRTNHHLFQPLLYQMATGILAEGDIAPPIRDILRRQRNASVLLGEVQAIDLRARRLTVDTLGVRGEIVYDSLILATGARQSYFGRPDFAWDAPGMKTIDDALELRGRIFGAFEMAEREPDPRLRSVWLTLWSSAPAPPASNWRARSQLARRSLRHNFRRIDPAESRIVLLDAAPTILSSFPQSLQRRAARELERLGVELHLGARVTGVDARGIDTTPSSRARGGSRRRPRSGRRGSKPRRWGAWSPRHRARVWIAVAAWRYCRTARCLGTRRCS